MRDSLFDQHFIKIAEHLFTGRFIPDVQELLQGQQMDVDDIEVKLATETFLFAFRADGCVTKALNNIYDTIVGGDRVTIAELRKLLDHWNHC